MAISNPECEDTRIRSAWVHCVDKDKMGSRVDSETLSTGPDMHLMARDK